MSVKKRQRSGPRKTKSRNSPSFQAKAFGKVSAEELFRPITKRLAPIEEEPKAEKPGPDYTMDESDRTNPFAWDESFRAEVPTPPSSEQDEEEEEEEDDFPRTARGRRGFCSAPPLPPIEEEEEEGASRKTWEEPGVTEIFTTNESDVINEFQRRKIFKDYHVR